MAQRGIVGLGVLAVLAAGVYFARDTGPVRGTLDKLGAIVSDKPAPKKRRAVPPAPVLTTTAGTRTIPVRLEAIGTVQSPSTVSIKARVDGQLVEALVKEGQIVKKGDLLFRIDPRPFRAQLSQAEAALARDQATLAKARADLDRYKTLSSKGYSSQQKYEESVALTRSLAATIRAGQAAVEFARLQLEYTTLRSPINGRTGSILVTPGNMIKANDTQALLIITETQPIHVAFSIPEHKLAEVKRRAAAGRLKVSVAIPEDTGPPIIGELFFINNMVDVSTGTIQLKALFANADDRLTPGQFVRATMQLSDIKDAVVVPSATVQSGRNGLYVYVVKPDLTVEVRPVETGPSLDDVTAILSGLKVGERVVTDGQLRLFPGAKVAPKDRKGPGGPADAKKGDSKKKRADQS
ncbi:MAG: efflux RND transporter periplasmic adaptor subunit [Hyphomicrobiaceae bacterium]|nr:efflux RND transporter periplasmic adaptor subunit [Hyphomicrobiaceae bacterium]